MFSLFVVSFAYVCYFTYIKCFKTKSLSFEDKNIRAFDFIKMDIFTDMDVLTVYSPYREIEDDVKYIIIEYEYDDKIMKYCTDKYYKFPMYTSSEVVNRVFSKTILCATINGVCVTKELKMYLGPNTNFYVDIPGPPLDLNKILKMDCSTGLIEITDNMGNKEQFPLPWIPVWNPSII